MTKKDEKKLTDHIVTLIGDSIKASDYILINDLVDWVKISEKAKDELQEGVKQGSNMNWQTLTTIAMASKQMQSIMQRLNITPEKRAKQIKQDVDEQDVDLNQLLA